MTRFTDYAPPFERSTPLFIRWIRWLCNNPALCEERYPRQRITLDEFLRLPVHRQVPVLCEDVVRVNPYAVLWLQPHQRTPHVLLLAATADPSVVSEFGSEELTPEICEIVRKKYGGKA